MKCAFLIIAKRLANMSLCACRNILGRLRKRSSESRVQITCLVYRTTERRRPDLPQQPGSSSRNNAMSWMHLYQGRMLGRKLNPDDNLCFIVCPTYMHSAKTRHLLALQTLVAAKGMWCILNIFLSKKYREKQKFSQKHKWLWQQIQYSQILQKLSWQQINTKPLFLVLLIHKLSKTLLTSSHAVTRSTLTKCKFYSFLFPASSDLPRSRCYSKKEYFFYLGCWIGFRRRNLL